jgi:hypothetical protein
MSRTRIRTLSRGSSVAALAALGLAVLANNRSLGFGFSIPRRFQLGLFAVAITLCAVQLALYLSGHRKEDNHGKRNKWS